MEDLDLLRKKYIHTPIPNSLKDSGWEKLSSKLPEQLSISGTGFKKSVLTSLVIVLSFIFLAGASQFSKPGNPLYTLKIISNQTIKKITNPNRSLQQTTIEVKKHSPTPSPTPTPTPSPSPSVTPSPSAKPSYSANEQSERESGQALGNEQNPSSKPSDISNGNSFGNNKLPPGQVKGESNEKRNENANNQNSNRQEPNPNSQKK